MSSAGGVKTLGVCRASAQKIHQCYRLLVLVSGNGTNLQALIDAEKAGRLGPARLCGVVSDRGGAFALERARQAGLPAFIEAPRGSLPKPERGRELSDRILRLALKEEADLIVLAGFLSILAGDLLDAYEGRIINLHPSLLPAFGGQGMYGERVHRAVLEAGERESGCTVHRVDAGTDTGTILLQRRVPVLAGDDPASLAERIHREEHIALVEAVAMLAKKSGSSSLFAFMVKITFGLLKRSPSLERRAPLRRRGR